MTENVPKIGHDYLASNKEKKKQEEEEILR